MSKKFLLIILTVCLYLSANGQNFEWAKTYGQQGSGAYSMKVDSIGNVYKIGGL